jgi:hypothetical protein
VTYLFYELQRRYRLFERLYRVQPVVLVAQEFPRPKDIDQSWLVRHDWILRRAILDDSFLPVLDDIARTAGDEIALDEMRLNVNQQRCIVGELRRELAIVTQQATEQRQLMDRTDLAKDIGTKRAEVQICQINPISRQTPYDQFNFEIPKKFPVQGMSAAVVNGIVNSETWTDANPIPGVRGLESPNCTRVNGHSLRFKYNAARVSGAIANRWVAFDKSRRSPNGAPPTKSPPAKP